MNSIKAILVFLTIACIVHAQSTLPKATALEEHFFQTVSAAITATASDASNNDPYGALVIAIKP